MKERTTHGGAFALWRSTAASTAPITMPIRSPAIPPSKLIAVTNQMLIGETTIVDAALIVTIQPRKAATEIPMAARYALREGKMR